MKMNFKYKNKFRKQLGLEKHMEKLGHLSGFHVSFMSHGPQFVKNCTFVQFLLMSEI